MTLGKSDTPRRHDGGMRLDPDIERRAAHFAATHHGYLPLAAALELGHTPETLERRVRSGVLERPWPGLYRVAGSPRTWQGDTYAAVAAAPTGSVASHMSSAALLGYWLPPPLPHVTVPRGANARGRLARVHQSAVPERDRTMIGVIAATHPARTVVDCAALLPFEALCELIDAARVAGRIRHGSVEAAMARASTRPGRKGFPALPEALAVWNPAIEHDSVAEARLFRLVVRWGFPAPVTLYVVRDSSGRPVCEIDAAWPDDRVGLDYDSPEFHNPRRWGRDEARHAAAEALGWDFVSVDKTDLMPGGQTRFRSELTELLGGKGDATTHPLGRKGDATTRQVGG